jgi:uncharacterized protein (DUF433 family)
MTSRTDFVPTPEAAFLADLSDRDMNRVVDEHILPESLIRIDRGRRFARLGAAFARFYFNTAELRAEFRRNVLKEVTTRLIDRPDSYLILSLTEAMPKDLNWRIKLRHTDIDLSEFVHEAWKRTRDVERVDTLVKADPKILGGLAVFVGTRVPVDTVLASLDKPIDKHRLIQSYPFLKDEHIDAARIYTKIHPTKGRPRRLAEVNPNWKIKSSRIVRPAAKA